MPVEPDPASGYGFETETGAPGCGLAASDKSGQQEVYLVLDGSAIAVLDGEHIELGPGDLVAIEPEVRRSVRAEASPTTLLAIGGTPGKPYEIGDWEK